MPSKHFRTNEHLYCKYTAQSEYVQKLPQIRAKELFFSDKLLVNPHAVRIINYFSLYVHPPELIH